jgi:thiol:disulfide interchange protein DsbA
MDRRKFLAAAGLGAAALAASGTAWALTAGKDYVLLSQPLPTEAADKVEVTEFFWYGCPHCHDLEPLLAKWTKTLAKDVQFVRIPAIFRDDWIIGAKLFYALEAIGQLAGMHTELFGAIHVGRISPKDDKALIDLLVKKGVDRAKLTEAYNSFAVQSKVKRAEQLTRQSKIGGVPSMIVDGRYMTSGSMTGSHEAMIAAVDQLVEKARGERKKK